MAQHLIVNAMVSGLKSMKVIKIENIVFSFEFRLSTRNVSKIRGNVGKWEALNLAYILSL